MNRAERDQGYVTVTQRVISEGPLTPAEINEDLRRGYEAACHAVSGAVPVHDDPAGANGVIARNLADLLIARGLDLDSVAFVAVLLRAEGYRRLKAAREIVRLTNSQSAQWPRPLTPTTSGSGEEATGAKPSDASSEKVPDEVAKPMRGRAGAADTPATSNRLGVGVPAPERTVPRYPQTETKES